MNKQKREAELEKRQRSNDVYKELSRLRNHCLLQNNFPLLDLSHNDIAKRQQSSVTIIFQNICRFDSNRRALANDFGYEQADIILWLNVTIKLMNVL